MEEVCSFEILVKNFRHLEAMGLWLYLSIQPEGSRIVKEQIKRHFGIGTSRVNRLISILVAHHLLRVVREKDSHGRFKSADYVLNHTDDFLYIPDSSQEP